MNGYLLDTNVISELSRITPEPQVISFLTDHGDCWLPAILMYELEFGLQILPQGRRMEQLRTLQSSILNEYEDRVIPIGRREAEMTAILQADASTTTTRLGWRLHPAFTAGGAASFVGAARPLVA